VFSNTKPLFNPYVSGLIRGQRMRDVAITLVFFEISMQQKYKKPTKNNINA